VEGDFMARYDFVLFDADNTLFDFDLSESRALRKVLEQYGFEVTPTLLERYHAINRGLWARFDRGEVEQAWLLAERFALLLKEMGKDGDPADMNRAYLKLLGSCGVLYPGAEALCRALAPHCTLAIVTNGASVAQRGRFEPSPIRTLISYLFISEEIGFQKPQKEFFDTVYRDMGITDLSRAVMVGDNLRTDILGGINAGLDTIWYNPHRLQADGAIIPTWDADSFDAIERIILNS
jgi:2-haloacid dehalogenase